jgi:hypothetical protein
VGTERAARLLEHARSLLGEPDPRTYLVMSINNAELRGGGGLLSGIGTITFDGGAIEVGPQYPREFFVRKPYQSVPAPAPYLQRYGSFKANTTLWANVTYSPDLVDDALVATRLFEKETGTATDGALIVDPRGLEALIPPGTTIPLPGTDQSLADTDLARWIYSDAYAQYDDDDERRAAILEVGRLALSSALDGGLEPGSIQELGAAVSGGHVALISFDQEELAALEDLGLATTVGEDATGDYLLAAAQNFGDGRGEGTKLDYWIERSVRHGCAIDDAGVARCAAEIALENQAPEGLTRYVAGEPYALLRSYVEVMIPRAAELTGIYVDGQPSEYRPYVEQDVRSIAVYVRVPRLERRVITVEYELPAREDYSLVLRPQPLAHDANVKLLLRVPQGWSVSSPLVADGDVYTFDGSLTGTIRVHAQPDRRLGLSALLDALKQ